MGDLRVTIWLISDTHFGHYNIVEYCQRVSPRQGVLWHTAEEMDEELVERWNAVVRPSDHVWHLGDVAMRRPALKVVERLHGHKRLVWGNHDIFDYKSYAEVGFKKMAGVRVFSAHNPRLICTHIPIHPDSLGRHINIHGHTHNKPPFGPQYVNVSVEVINYQPISLEQAVAQAQQQMAA